MTRDAGRASRKEENDYFDSLYEWTARKHRILEKYAAACSKIVGRLFCVDAFAGRGEHRDGNRGSPLITADVAMNYLEGGKDYSLRCINVEANHEHFEHLQRVTARYPPGLVTNLEGPFAGHVSGILQRIGDTPTLFFLDPFGVDGLYWDALVPILRRRPITELLINFNVRSAARLAGHVGSTAVPAAAKVALLDRVVGTQGWKGCMSAAEVLDPDLESDSIGECTSRVYMDQVRRAGFDLVEKYPVRSVADGHVRYYLLFATRSAKGLVVMNDILAGTEEHYLGERESLTSGPVLQPSLFAEYQPPSPEQKRAAFECEIGDTIVAALSAEPNQRMTYLRLQCKLAATYFARARRMTYNDALKALKERGLVVWTAPGKGLPQDGDVVMLQHG